MSAVLNFFRESPQRNEEVHTILSKIQQYGARLSSIRQTMMGCCAPRVNEAGKVELTVADMPRWDKLSEEEAAITAKLAAIGRMVAELDAIFGEIEAQGISCPNKTLRGLWAIAPYIEAPYQEGEYINANGKRVTSSGRVIASYVDPKFGAWIARASEAMAGL